MANESIMLEIDGDEAEDLYDDIVALEVELSDELPATFRLCLALAKEPGEGAWSYQDEPQFRIWKPVRVAIGFADSGPEELIQGFITRVEPHYTADEGESLLEVTGADASILMDRAERLKDWPNKKDSDIAREICGFYPFATDIQETEVVHEEAVSTVIQRETDLQFLNRLALRNGFEFYVEGTTARFRAPAESPPQPLLAAHFGEETNLRCFNAAVDALRPTRVRMIQVDRLDKQVRSAGADSLEDEPMGELDADALLPEGPAGDPTVFVANNAVTGVPEMEALCRRLHAEGASFVTGEGDIDAAAYGHVLKPRGRVTIKGVGESYSGVYYVSFVRHTVTRDGYTQSFRARRDALMPAGDEDFSGNGGGLL
jgi:hypothetical protein